MQASPLRRTSRPKRFPHLSISPHGQVFLDGELVGSVDSIETAWGATLWGFRLSGTATDLHYVEGDKWAAARICAVAYIRRRADRARRLSGEPSRVRIPEEPRASVHGLVEVAEPGT